MVLDGREVRRVVGWGGATGGVGVGESLAGAIVASGAVRAVVVVLPMAEGRGAVVLGAIVVPAVVVGA